MGKELAAVRKFMGDLPTPVPHGSVLDVLSGPDLTAKDNAN
jgi:hypothetical protein